MNHFAHALPHLDRPAVMIGACLPDWLSAADRKCRVRAGCARMWIAHSDLFVSGLARGIAHHYHDDDWFHRNPVFNRLQWEFAAQLREWLVGDRGLRPRFVGHIAVELLLDSHLIGRYPDELTRHYELVRRVDWERVQWAVNLMAPRRTDRIARFLARYTEAEYLRDYQQDGRLLYRLNQIMMRVKLPRLDDALLTWLPEARRRVGQSVQALLPHYAIPIS